MINFYYCVLFQTPEYYSHYSLECKNGANYRKVHSVLRDLNYENKFLLSYHNTKVHDASNILHISNKSYSSLFLPFNYSNKFFRLFSKSINFLSFVRKNNNCKFLIYNYSFEFLLGAIYLFFKKNKVYLDVEDLPVNRPLVRESISKLLLKLFLLVSDRNIFTASSGISKYLINKRPIEIFGSVENIKQDIKFYDHMSLHFGGTVNHDTGLSILIDALKLLNKNEFTLKRMLKIYITADLSSEHVSILNSLESEMLQIKIFNKLSVRDYNDIFNMCNVGLSLKLKSGIYSSTTFPSKVIEIVSSNKLLITTELPDVKIIFSENSVLFCEDCGNDLAKKIQTLSNFDEINFRNFVKSASSDALKFVSGKNVSNRILQHMEIEIE